MNENQHITKQYAQSNPVSEKKYDSPYMYMYKKSGSTFNKILIGVFPLNGEFTSDFKNWTFVHFY